MLGVGRGKVGASILTASDFGIDEHALANSSLVVDVHHAVAVQTPTAAAALLSTEEFGSPVGLVLSH